MIYYSILGVFDIRGVGGLNIRGRDEFAFWHEETLDLMPLAEAASKGDMVHLGCSQNYEPLLVIDYIAILNILGIPKMGPKFGELSIYIIPI